MRSRAFFSLLGMVLAISVASSGAAKSPATVGTPANMPAISASRLPQEAQDTLALIRAGGPFPYRKDGVTFFNREQKLPVQPRGYYREYTVKTQGARNRGKRRMVCGGTEPTNTQNCYYTDDHYATFKKIQH